MKHSSLNPFLKIFFNKTTRSRFGARGVADFYRLNFNFVGRTLREKPSAFWEAQGEEMALSLFHEAARRVPAYKDFLKRHGVKPSFIKTIDDFRRIPWVDKQNYFRQYPPNDLCWNGKLSTNTLFSVSSGSSGKPFFWPRGDNLEFETSLVYGMILKEIFGADRIPTLFVVSFSMGIYIAGVVTLNSVLRTAETGLPLTIVTPGVEIDDVIRVVRELGPHYEQVILAGYPPFVKDIIDKGETEGIKWWRMRVKFLFAAENFSEAFRNYLFEKVGVRDPLRASVSIYGTAEASILGHETPLSESLRRAAIRDRALYRDLFANASYMPTLVQYNPILKFFEEELGELIITAYGGIPLVRYNLHDSGRILRFSEVRSLPNVISHKDTRKLARHSWQLPFVQVFGRSDLAISFYGLKIYPENIKAGLETKECMKAVSGKFTMEQRTRKNQDQYWTVNIELKEGVSPGPRRRNMVFNSLMRALRSNNLEYDRLYEAIGAKAHPAVNLFRKGDPRYFGGRAAKQRWIARA